MEESKKLMLGLGVLGASALGYLLVKHMGRSKIAIVYWSPEDSRTVSVLERELKKFYDVSVLFQKESPKAEYIIQIGGQYVNPVYKKYMEMGKLAVISPNYRDPGPQVVGNTVFIAGWSKEDTYNIAIRWLKSFIGVEK